MSSMKKLLSALLVILLVLSVCPWDAVFAPEQAAAAQMPADNVLRYHVLGAVVWVLMVDITPRN